MKGLVTALAAPMLLVAGVATAGEHPIGEPVELNGMQVAAVYLQAVKMEPHHAHHDNTDIHLEADIKGLKGNNNGFGEGEWIPYLKVDYVVTKVGTDWKAAGAFDAMVASDGPHYGANVKMNGPGKYHVAYTISPAAFGFLRHTDKETGVGKWWDPFTVEWDFTFVGSAGKKGGY
ncbi:MAG: iron transporter [Solirubrobacterales bacterium]